MTTINETLPPFVITHSSSTNNILLSLYLISIHVKVINKAINREIPPEKGGKPGVFEKFCSF